MGKTKINKDGWKNTPNAFYLSAMRTTDERNAEVANYPQQLASDLEAFVLNIFEQPFEKAYRRSRVYYPKQIEEYLVSSFEMRRHYIAYSLKCFIKKLYTKLKINGYHLA